MTVVTSVSMRRVARASFVLLAALLGCAPARPEATSPATAAAAGQTGTADASPPAPAPASSPAAGAAALDDDPGLQPGGGFLRGIGEKGTDPEPSDAATTARELEEGVRHGQVFRQLLVGALAMPSRRLTWVLSRTDQHVALALFCQSQRGKALPWLHLDSREQLDSTWSSPVRTTFRGPSPADGAPMRLATANDLGAMWACVQIARTLVVTCRPSVVAVLHAGALLLGDHAHPPIRWQPAALEQVHGQSCLLTRDAVDPGVSTERPIAISFDVPLVFAEPRPGSAGIEWAFDNSDEVIQAGAYRWVPRAP